MSAENESFLKDKKIIDAADEASAREALADQPSYACWKMSRTPNAYKELNSSEGKFGQVQATATELKGLKATLNTNDHHVDYAISFSGADNVIKANNVSAPRLRDLERYLPGL